MFSIGEALTKYLRFSNTFCGISVQTHGANATIEHPLDSVDERLEKSSLFADFKAVKDGNVWCTGKYLYQATDVIGSMIQDIHTMLTDDLAEELSFMVRLH